MKSIAPGLLRDLRERVSLAAASPRARAGGMALLSAAGLGLFVLLDLGGQGPAAATPSLALGERQGVILRRPAGAVTEEVAQADSLAAASPFVLSAADQSSRERALQCLAEAVYYEAASESVDGQRAVAQVVLNRVRHAAFPNSVCGVVYQGSTRSTGCQFTFTCDGSLSRQPSRSGWATAVAVAREALAGAVFAPVGHATHYHASWMRPYWAPSVALVGQIGGHIFYGLKGRIGGASAFNQAYAGIEASTTRLAEAEAEELPVLGGELALADMGKPVPQKVEEEALADPANADLLNFRRAADDRPGKPDEARVASSVEAALAPAAP